MLSGLFNMDNPFWRTMALIADLLIANALFIICSLPIVTIGASATALYTVTLKQVKKEEGYITSTFFRAFKNNFKQSTIIWLMMLVAGLILGFNIYLLKNMNIPGEKVIQYLIGFVCLIFIMTSCYVFPLQCKFDNTIKQTIQNALLLSIANFFPRTILIIVLHALPVLVLLISPVMIAYLMPVMIMGGFALIAYLSSKMFYKIFSRYIPEETFDVDPDAFTLKEVEEEDTPSELEQLEEK